MGFFGFKFKKFWSCLSTWKLSKCHYEIFILCVKKVGKLSNLECGFLKLLPDLKLHLCIDPVNKLIGTNCSQIVYKLFEKAAIYIYKIIRFYKARNSFNKKLFNHKYLIPLSLNENKMMLGQCFIN